MKDGTEELRSIISEIINDELLEFSASGAVAGFTLPLGMKPRRPKVPKLKKRKKVNESVEPFTLNNYIRYFNNEDSYKDNESKTYYDSVCSLVKAFCISENPFGESSVRGTKNAKKYLQGDLEYPHRT